MLISNLEILKDSLNKKLGAGYRVYFNKTQLNIDIEESDIKVYTRVSDTTSNVVLYLYNRGKEFDIIEALDGIPKKFKLWSKFKTTSEPNQIGIYGVMLENVHHIVREFNSRRLNAV